MKKAIITALLGLLASLMSSGATDPEITKVIFGDTEKVELQQGQTTRLPLPIAGGVFCEVGYSVPGDAWTPYSAHLLFLDKERNTLREEYCLSGNGETFYNEGFSIDFIHPGLAYISAALETRWGENKTEPKIYRVTFNDSDDDGAIEAVTENDTDTPVEFFTLDGLKVESPSQGIFIRRQGSTATKVVM